MLNFRKLGIVLWVYLGVCSVAQGSDTQVENFFNKANELSSLPFYDEAWQEDGSPREAYASVANAMTEVAENEEFRTWFKEKTLEDFQTDNILIPYPRMLSQEENVLLQKGVLQRAKALSAFLKTRFSSNKEEIYKIIPKEIFDKIEARNFEDYTDGKFENISFWYGPDIIRGPDGKFYIIEDNLSYVGGMGDLELASESFVKRAPNYGLNSQKGEEFYNQIADKYKRMAEAKGGEAVVIRYPFAWGADNEDKRMTKAFKSRGIKVIQLNGQMGTELNRSLEFSDDGVYFINKKLSKRKKVGLIVIDGEFCDFDASNKASMKKYIFDTLEFLIDSYEEKIEKLKLKNRTKRIKKFEKFIEEIESVIATVEKVSMDKLRRLKRIMRQCKFYQKNFVKEMLNEGFPGLIKSYEAGQIDLINGPGTESLNDKEFYMYVEEMIRSYTGEEPLVNNIPTMSFAKGSDLNQELFDKVFAIDEESGEYSNRHKLVVKKVVGRGGEFVWVGPKIDDEKFSELEDLIKANPSDYIVQVYLALSQLQGNIVDLRYIADVSTEPNETIIAPFPWGRGVNFESGNGKVNISDKGGETAVFIASSEELTDSSTTLSELQAALTLQKFFRTYKAKLDLTSKDSEFLKNPKVQSLLAKAEQKSPEFEDEDFEDLSDDEFLFAFRKILQFKDSEGRIILSSDCEDAFIEELVERFELDQKGYKNENFDKQGIKGIVEFYELNHSKLKDVNIEYIFRGDENLPDLSSGEGKYIFIQDLGMKRGITDHVSMFYVDYDLKKVYLFDSIGFDKEDLDDYMKAFGSDFSIWCSSLELQKDGENCMIFVTEVMKILANYPESFFDKLNFVGSTNGLKKSDCAHPETVILAQSMSLIKRYDSWFDFISSQSETMGTAKLKRKFSKEFISVIPKDNDKKNLALLAEAKSFRKDWLETLHKDRDYLASVSNVEKRLLEKDGAVKFDSESSKVQNYLMNRLRMKFLYYMATKETFNSSYVN